MVICEVVENRGMEWEGGRGKRVVVGKGWIKRNGVEMFGVKFGGGGGYGK